MSLIPCVVLDRRSSCGTRVPEWPSIRNILFVRHLDSSRTIEKISMVNSSDNSDMFIGLMIRELGEEEEELYDLC